MTRASLHLRACRWARLSALALVLVAVDAWAEGVTAIDGVAVTVGDLPRAERFYTEVLGFSLERHLERQGPAWSALYGLADVRITIARLRLGAERLDLMAFNDGSGREVPATTAANDRIFQHVAIVVDDMQTAYAQLRAHDVRHASSAPQRLPVSIPAAAGIEAFYFRDPDGHFLELLHFPADKGSPRWHESHGPHFRGLDHTAIVVASTRAALSFWQDVLGLRVAGTSENQGYEQEHLNNVFGAHLLITGLRTEQGPGVELLHYLAPDNGRVAPQDTRVNDLWSWQIEARAGSRAAFDALDRALREHGYRAVSSVPIDLPAAEETYARAHLWRDADGHAVLLTSP